MPTHLDTTLCIPALARDELSSSFDRPPAFHASSLLSSRLKSATHRSTFHARKIASPLDPVGRIDETSGSDEELYWIHDRRIDLEPWPGLLVFFMRVGRVRTLSEGTGLRRIWSKEGSGWARSKVPVARQRCRCQSAKSFELMGVRNN